MSYKANCLNCKKPLVRISPKGNNKKFCNTSCRNKARSEANKKRVAEWQRAKQDRLASEPSDTKVQCLICGRYYVQVGSHIVQRHNITAREYREYYELEVKRGTVPDWFRELKGKQALENGTFKNLKVGKKFWFKKGQKGVGVYKRSPITLERIRKIQKLSLIKKGI